MKIISNGKIWPYSIGFAITAVFSFCVATVFVTQSANIQESEAYMTHYQDADANANDLIKSRIAFDRKYNIEYLTKGITAENSVLKFRITNKENKIVENAKIILSVSRPETDEFTQNNATPKIENGVYSFSGIEFPKPGIWNLITKIDVGSDSRFYNLKVDTRHKVATEF